MCSSLDGAARQLVLVNANRKSVPQVQDWLEVTTRFQEMERALNISVPSTIEYPPHTLYSSHNACSSLRNTNHPARVPCPTDGPARAAASFATQTFHAASALSTGQPCGKLQLRLRTTA
ncbi:hypothetical protein GALMADRAFT_1245965 [Galerina marginata CBS 339.88]|uniref:Uncharacterized protein n=1 Tax=Galerina marginata (strain CBS 339.88) TaxID=685588 RepID=A0A067T8Z5_GALM3|nr:hypothetical protein GALMADRAFT_1245965 [Galerina marginata CBS 339.88]